MKLIKSAEFALFLCENFRIKATQEINNNGWIFEDKDLEKITSLEINEFRIFKNFVEEIDKFQNIKNLTLKFNTFDEKIDFIVPSTVEKLSLNRVNFENLDLTDSKHLKILELNNSKISKIQGLYNLKLNEFQNISTNININYKKIFENNEDIRFTIPFTILSNEFLNDLSCDLEYTKNINFVEPIFSEGSKKAIFLKIKKEDVLKINKKIEKIINENISQEFNTLEKILMCAVLARKNIKIPDEKEFNVNEYRVSKTLLENTPGYCQSVTKYMQLLLNKLNIESEQVGCVIKELEEQNEDYLKEEFVNHSIIKVKIDGSWFYFDPTFLDQNINNPMQGLFETKKEMLGEKIINKGKVKYVLSASEKSDEKELDISDIKNMLSTNTFKKYLLKKHGIKMLTKDMEYNIAHFGFVKTLKQCLNPTKQSTIVISSDFDLDRICAIICDKEKIKNVVVKSDKTKRLDKKLFEYLGYKNIKNVYCINSQYIENLFDDLKEKFSNNKQKPDKNFNDFSR